MEAMQRARAKDSQAASVKGNTCLQGGLVSPAGVSDLSLRKKLPFGFYLYRLGFFVVVVLVLNGLKNNHSQFSKI